MAKEGWNVTALSIGTISKEGYMRNISWSIFRPSLLAYTNTNFLSMVNESLYDFAKSEEPVANFGTFTAQIATSTLFRLAYTHEVYKSAQRQASDLHHQRIFVRLMVFCDGHFLVSQHEGGPIFTTNEIQRPRDLEINERSWLRYQELKMRFDLRQPEKRLKDRCEKHGKDCRRQALLARE
jgi:hypothetical protein